MNTSPSVCIFCMMMMKMKLLQMEVSQQKPFPVMKLLRANGDDIDDLP